MKTSTAILTLILVATSPAHAVLSGTTCEALFDKPAAVTQLNEPSQEFLSRLQYLTVERHLLEAKDLQEITNSPRPVNPFAKRSQTVQSLPHRSSFETLLSQDLQWSLIREQTQTLIKSLNQDQKREQTAKAETRDVLMPVPLQSLPFRTDKVFETPEGQLLAFTVSYTSYPNALYIHDTHLKAFDIATGKEAYSASYRGLGKTDDLDFTWWQGALLATAANGDGNGVHTINLQNNNLFPYAEALPVNGDPSYRDPPVPNFNKKSYFVERNGKPAVITFQGHHLHTLDVVTGQPVEPAVPFAAPRKSEVKISGKFGSFIFASADDASSLIIDTSGKRPLQVTDGFMIISAFIHKGQRLAIGWDLDKGRSLDEDHKALTLLNLDSGQKSEPLIYETDYDDGQPRLIDHFEQNGTIYGLLATDNDVYRVNFRTGKIEHRISATSQAQTVWASWTEKDRDQVGFDFKGQRYIIARIVDRKLPLVSQPGQLVILNAMTLEAASPPMTMPDVPDHVHMLPGDSPRVLINLFSGMSQIFSLVKPL